MADAKPFRAVRYAGAAGRLADLVAPPYDAVDDDERAELYTRSPYNVVHVTLPESAEGAGRLYRDWLAAGILEQDDDPSAWVSVERYVGPDGVPRERFLAGEPFSLEIELAGAVEAAALQLEIRDASGLLVAEEILDPRSLVNGGPAGVTLRFDVPSPPLQFGRFDVALALLGADGRLIDRLADSLPLLVYPDGEGRGLVRLEGTWRRGAKDVGR